MTLPRLHVVTNDDVLAAEGFGDRARSLLAAHGPALALHLRVPTGPVRWLLEAAETLVGPATDAGALLVVNGRPDVALAAGVAAVQLGHQSISVQAVRALMGDEVLIGYSAHGAAEAASAVENGADFVLIGTIWPSASHPDREPAGVGRVRDAAGATTAPVIAIGGVTPNRVPEAVGAGAWGVAAIRGVWAAEDPAEAAASYLHQLRVDGS